MLTHTDLALHACARIVALTVEAREHLQEAHVSAMRHAQNPTEADDLAATSRRSALRARLKVDAAVDYIRELPESDGEAAARARRAACDLAWLARATLAEAEGEAQRATERAEEMRRGETRRELRDARVSA